MEDADIAGINCESSRKGKLSVSSRLIEGKGFILVVVDRFKITKLPVDIENHSYGRL